MPAIIRIEDPADPRIEPYRDIRERDLIGREGLFVAEGKVVIEKLATSPAFRPVSLLIDARRLESLAALLSKLGEDVPVYCVSAALLRSLAGFDVHRGLLGIGRRTDPPSPAALLAGLSDRATILFLSKIANHDNMGGIFRNAAAFGADAVLIDADCCDPLYRKAIRVSVGAALLVPWARLARGEDPLALLEDHGVTPIALSPNGKMRLAELAPPRRAAVLLGAEGPGLDARLLAGAETVRIPMADGFDSLNVATTSGIVLHHLREAGPRAAQAGRKSSANPLMQ